MPLSEHEQRLFDQIERSLAEDPKFASAVRASDPRFHARRRLLVAAFVIILGLALVVYGTVSTNTLLGVYPGLAAVRLVGTDLVQAVPLVLSAAVSNILVNHGIDWSITLPLIVGSVPGTILGSSLAPKVPQSFIRRGIVVVLTMSGVAPPWSRKCW